MEGVGLPGNPCIEDPPEGPPLPHTAPPTASRPQAGAPLTLANSVLPVPGGPYIKMFLYRLWFFLVFLVEMAMSRTRASRLGCQGTGRLRLKDTLLLSLSLLSAQASAHPHPHLCPAGSTTYTEDHALQGVLRLTEEPPADLWGNQR